MRQDLGARIQNGIGSLPDPPSRVYPERTKRCGGGGGGGGGGGHVNMHGLPPLGKIHAAGA